MRRGMGQHADRCSVARPSQDMAVTAGRQSAVASQDCATDWPAWMTTATGVSQGHRYTRPVLAATGASKCVPDGQAVLLSRQSGSAHWVVAGRTGDCRAATQLCFAVGCSLSPFAKNLVELTYGFASMSDQSVDKLPQRSGLQKVVGQSHIRLLGESLREGQWRKDRL